MASCLAEPSRRRNRRGPSSTRPGLTVHTSREALRHCSSAHTLSLFSDPTPNALYTPAAASPVYVETVVRGSQMSSVREAGLTLRPDGVGRELTECRSSPVATISHFRSSLDPMTLKPSEPLPRRPTTLPHHRPPVQRLSTTVVSIPVQTAPHTLSWPALSPSQRRFKCAITRSLRPSRCSPAHLTVPPSPSSFSSVISAVFPTIAILRHCYPNVPGLSVLRRHCTCRVKCLARLPVRRRSSARNKRPASTQRRSVSSAGQLAMETLFTTAPHLSTGSCNRQSLCGEPTAPVPQPPLLARRRRALSEATGMQVECEASGSRSTVSFAQEHLCQRTFESAGRRRATLLSIFVPSLKDQQTPTEMAGRPIIRRAYSALPAFASPSAPNRIFNRPFDSPAESPFASLARTLAMASTAPRFPPGTETSVRATASPSNVEPTPAMSPWPVSAFSDYSSSECSTRACTPWSATGDDPFEFDTATSNSRPTEAGDSYFPPQPPQDDYEQFAAAIQRNPLNYTFVLPSFPPKRLIERRPAFRTQDSEDITSASPLTPPSTNSPQPVASAAEPVLTKSPGPGSLASRRHRPSLMPLGIRANSYTETGTSPRPALPVRRTNSMGDDPAASGGAVEPPVPSLQSEAPDSVTRSSNSRLSQLFSPQSLLPPPSPPTSGEDDAIYGHIHHQISPPHTPQPSSMAFTLEPQGPIEEEEENQGTLKAQPRLRTVPPPMSIALPPNDQFIASFSGMSIGSDGQISGVVDMYSNRDMFPFDDIIGQMI